MQKKLDLTYISTRERDVLKLDGLVEDLFWHRKMYRDYVQIVSSNPKINESNVFHDFVSSSYVSSIVLGICRLVDFDPKTLSLIILLKNLQSNADKIRKEWYADGYKDMFSSVPFLDTSAGISYGSGEWQKNYGSGDFLDAQIIDNDIASLKEATSKVFAFRDKRIAHYERNAAEMKILVDDLDVAIEEIGRVNEKYYQLFTRKGKSDNEPSDGTEYKKIFKTNWMS